MKNEDLKDTCGSITQLTENTHQIPQGLSWNNSATLAQSPIGYIEKTTKQLFIEGVIDVIECERRLKRELEYEHLKQSISM